MKNKYDALSKILKDEKERKNRIRNVVEFEEGGNSLERRQNLEQQWKENRLKENLRMNKQFLQEQIKFKMEQDKFEKDLEINQATQMNMKAQEELDREAKKQENERKRRLKHKDDLRTQMNSKTDPYGSMTHQERLMNKDKLDYDE